MKPGENEITCGWVTNELEKGGSTRGQIEDRLTVPEKLPRICIIGPYHNIPGGQVIQAVEIIKELGREGRRIQFLPVNPPLYRFGGWCQKIRYVRTVVNLASFLVRLLAQMKYFDVLHVFAASYYSFLVASAPAVLLGRYFAKRIILNYHSGEAEDHLQRSPWVIRKVLEKADALVVPSPYLRNTFADAGFHCEVIGNVIDMDAFPFKKRAELRPKFIVNRSLEPMYNVGCVIKAFGIIQSEFRDAELMVIGQGSQQPYLRRLAKDLLLRNVTFVGWVDHDQMPSFLANADVFLNSSNIDNQPISILEAFSSGLPVISSRAGGIPYLIKDEINGCLVEMDDHQGIAQKAFYLLRNPDVGLRIARKARRDCEEIYSWKANRLKWLKIYGFEEKYPQNFSDSAQ